MSSVKKKKGVFIISVTWSLHLRLSLITTSSRTERDLGTAEGLPWRTERGKAGRSPATCLRMLDQHNTAGTRTCRPGLVSRVFLPNVKMPFKNATSTQKSLYYVLRSDPSKDSDTLYQFLQIKYHSPVSEPSRFSFSCFHVCVFKISEELFLCLFLPRRNPLPALLIKANRIEKETVIM